MLPQALEARRQKGKAAKTTKTVTPSPSPPPSPTPAPVMKAVQTATKILASIFNTLKKPLVGSKLYANNKAKLDVGWKRVQPLVKLLQWLWNQILKPLWVKVVQPLWAKLLDLLRPRLPGPLKTFSNRVLTAIIVGPLVLFWWLISSLTTAASVAQSPPSSPAVSTPKSVSKPASQKPTSAPSVQPALAPEAPIASAPSIEVVTEEPEKPPALPVLLVAAAGRPD